MKENYENMVKEYYENIMKKYKVDRNGLPSYIQTRIIGIDGIHYKILPMESLGQRVFNDRLIPTEYAVFYLHKLFPDSDEGYWCQCSKWYKYCQNAVNFMKRKACKGI